MHGPAAERSWIRLSLFAGFFLLLLAHAASYWPYFSDDALISLRYAQRLLDGHGLTWTEHPPRVEGYSNLLWLLLCAGLGGVGLDLVLAARLLGVLCLAGALLQVIRHAGERPQDPTPWPALLPGLILLGLAAPTAAWSLGGLEHPLTALLLALALPACFRLLEDERPRASTALAASLPLGLLCLTRPDGPLFTVGALGGIWLARRVTGRAARLRVILLLIVIPLLMVVAQLGFRLAYYGEWLPNTALVKLQPSLRHMLGGLKYVLHGTLALAPLSLLAGLWLLHGAWHRRPRALLLLTLTGLWLGYVVVIGGDFFAAFRHFLPVLVLLAFALVEAAREHGPWLTQQWRSRPRRSLAWLLLGLSTFLLLQRYDSGSRHAQEELWEWQGRELALTLKQAFAAQQPLLAVTAAGCLPYWSELPSLDLLGLTDAYIAKHPPADFGQGPLAHELGDADYVWSRQPDILCFHLGDREANFSSGRKLQARPDFLSTYFPLTLQFEHPKPFESTLWIRREGAIGIQRDPREVRVPGFLCSESPATRVRLVDGRLVALLTRGQPALLWLTDVDTSWTAQVDSRPQRVVRVEQRQESGRTRLELFTESVGDVFVREVVLRPALSAAR